MVTHWRPAPIMENPARQPRKVTNLHRPQIYVHVEFGVSWSQRHLPNNHEVTYRSKGLRDRATANFPRQVPPLNTNYLQPAAVPYYFDQQEEDNQRQVQIDQLYQQQHQQQQHEQIQQLQQPPAAPQQTYANVATSSTSSASQPQSRRHARHSSSGRRFQPLLESPQEESEENSRSSREGRPAMHERGHSAPPPINDSPWDVTQMVAIPLFPPSGVSSSSGATAAAAAHNQYLPQSYEQQQQQQGRIRTVSHGDSRLWKDLPEPPTSFRLGEEGMPWDALSWPMGYEPDADPEHARNPTSYPGERRMPTTFPGGAQRPDSMATNITYVPYSPIANIQVSSPLTPPHLLRRRVATAPAATTEAESKEMAVDVPVPVLPPSRTTTSTTTATTATLTTAATTTTERTVRNSNNNNNGGLLDDTGRTRDLSALSVAMMTIDNGFEDQWWNQGARETTGTPAAVASSPASQVPPPQLPPHPPISSLSDDVFVSPETATAQYRRGLHQSGFSAATSLGWAIATPSQPHFPRHQPSVTASYTSSSIVSPISPPTYSSFLGRSLSTRSEEAYLTGGRYA